MLQSSLSDAKPQIERATLRLMLSRRRLPTTMAILYLVILRPLASCRRPTAGAGEGLRDGRDTAACLRAMATRSV
jgi:hypothetical protein